METLETISENAIVFQSVADLVIADLKRDYMPLVVSGVNDKEGCKVVNEARKHVKKLRTGLEAERKKLKSKSLEYGRNLDAEAKRLSIQLAPIEDHLLAQEKIVTDEFARVKAAEQKAIEENHKQRIVDLIDAGAVFDGFCYQLIQGTIDDADIWNFSDEDFETIVTEMKEWKKLEDEKKAESERLAKIEIDKQTKINNKRIKDQAEIDQKQKVAQDKIDADNKILADREAKIEAAEKKIADDKAEAERTKAAVDKSIKDKEEAENKVEQDKLDKIEADKRAEALKPDKKKILDYLKKIHSVQILLLSSSDAKGLYNQIKIDICNVLDSSVDKLEQL